MYDAAGNLTTERTASTSRTHTYDAANRLTRILPGSGDDADLTYDPLGRIATRQVGANPLQTFRYVGATDLVWQQASSASTTSSIVDPGGARVGTTDGTASGGTWLLFDLLGSVAGAESGAAGAGSAVTTALRYDAFGGTIGTYPSTGSNLAVPYRGLIDLAPTTDTDVAGTGSDPLYAMGARLYAPHLGAFTSFDTYAGEAQDPASMNRYLYAYANPATLIDPTGHRICELDCQGNATPAEIEHSQEVAAKTGTASGGKSERSTGTNPGTTSTGPDDPATTTPVLTAGGAVPPGFTWEYLGLIAGNAAIQDGVQQGISSTIADAQSGDPFRVAHAVTGAALTIGTGIGAVASIRKLATMRRPAEVAPPKGAPKPALNFKTPTNRPQYPPQRVPDGWRVRVHAPTEQYPTGYWRLEKPLGNDHWQPIDPSTMKPGPREATHVPLPADD